MRRFAYGIGGMLALLPCLIGIAEARGSDSSTRWTERMLTQTSFHYQLTQGFASQWQLRKTTQAFSDILAKYGTQSAKAWAGLARSQAALGEYGAAVKSYKQALSLLPGHETMAAELDKVSDQHSAALAAGRCIPKGHSVLQALPYPGLNERDVWVVLSARVEWDRSYHQFWPTITDGRLTIFRGRPPALKRTWQSVVLGYPGYSDGEFNDLSVYVVDVTGDGTLDLVLPENFFGASWAPSHLDIYTWRSGRMVHLLGAVSDDPLAVRDLNGDGRYEVTSDHAVGWGVSHAGQPRWLSIYAYKNGTYQLANGDYPGLYHRLYREIRAALNDAPGDFELLYYLGRVYEILHRPQRALEAYRRADRGAEVEAAQWRRDDSPDLVRQVQNIQQEIQSRIRALRK